MRYGILFLAVAFIFSSCSAKSTFKNATGDPPSNKMYNILLKKYVTDDGVVDYAGLKEEEGKLDEYLDLLSNNPPNKDSWSRNEQIAYWINVYNAFTLKLILKHYPVESIKDIAGGIPLVNTPWRVKFINIKGEEYHLDNIEHGILRKDFNEPFIHVAVNCASVSCPKLRNEAFEAEKLERQFIDQADFFINHSGKNTISEDKLVLSKIFKWYGGDFDSVVDFVREYADKEFSEDPTIEYADYNWKLNSPKYMP
jgi:hypothetical protein